MIVLTKPEMPRAARSHAPVADENKPFSFDLGVNYMASVKQSDNTKKWTITILPMFAAGTKVIAELVARPSEKAARLLVDEWFDARDR
ncbi:hypothetical protein WK03_35710 [Burkholderia cepacia]|uniref:hypothetical protein n=1 Tax=Burkholderia cepacia TaxID=292 RepID=UPI00076BDF4F|nr:hypothetical protein [Burkholderia cepacia]KVQ35814.1 hypothetical protein WK03_35710 [Burkholderia cepacia]